MSFYPTLLHERLTPPVEPAPALFDDDFMCKLFRGQSQDDRTTLRCGIGLEFADTLRITSAVEVTRKGKSGTAK